VMCNKETPDPVSGECMGTCPSNKVCRQDGGKCKCENDECLVLDPDEVCRVTGGGNVQVCCVSGNGQGNATTCSACQSCFQDNPNNPGLPDACCDALLNGGGGIGDSSTVCKDKGLICCNYPGNPLGCNKGNCCVIPDDKGKCPTTPTFPTTAAAEPT
jgi:hypothetical protein